MIFLKVKEEEKVHWVAAIWQNEVGLVKFFFLIFFFILGLILGWIGSVRSNFISFGILKPKPDIFLKDFLINLFNFSYFFDFFFRENIFSIYFVFFIISGIPFSTLENF